MQEPSKATTTTTITPSIKSQDKGKGIMVEPKMPLKKKAQINLDEEFAFKLQAQQIEEVNLAWDDVQAKIEADYKMAQRLQAEEQEQLTDDEKAKLVMEFLEKKKKFFDAKRVEEKRNKPLTKAQQRSRISSRVVQQSGIQCFNCRKFGHFAKECRKPKRIKDFAYHKETMLSHKQAEKGVLLPAEQFDWLADTNEEIDEQELEAHYNYMAKIQEVPTAKSGTDSKPLEQ
nr:hypothetical protein [Tanacetum cinerariifolium]